MRKMAKRTNEARYKMKMRPRRKVGLKIAMMVVQQPWV